MAHSCNLNYMGIRDWDDGGLKAVQAKKSINKSGVLVCACDLSYMGGSKSEANPG
jgi:hypothetical protein